MNHLKIRKQCQGVPVKCFDLRVLDDLVNFRTTFDAVLFSTSDSEFPISFVSDLTADEDPVLSKDFLPAAFLLGGVESALDSDSDSLQSKFQ